MSKYIYFFYLNFNNIIKTDESKSRLNINFPLLFCHSIEYNKTSIFSLQLVFDEWISQCKKGIYDTFQLWQTWQIKQQRRKKYLKNGVINRNYSVITRCGTSVLPLYTINNHLLHICRKVSQNHALGSEQLCKWICCLPMVRLLKALPHKVTTLLKNRFYYRTVASDNINIMKTT